MWHVDCLDHSAVHDQRLSVVSRSCHQTTDDRRSFWCLPRKPWHPWRDFSPLKVVQISDNNSTLIMFYSLPCQFLFLCGSKSKVLNGFIEGSSLAILLQLFRWATLNRRSWPRDFWPTSSGPLPRYSGRVGHNFFPQHWEGWQRWKHRSALCDVASTACVSNWTQISW